MADSRDQAQALKRALVAVREMRVKLEALEGAQREPIAIVGMACRFPGSVDTLDDYWTLLLEGVDGIRDTPRDRWDVDAFYDKDPATPGKTYVREGGFLERVTGFDAEFFGITPREVASMDPQQRLLLEVAWEALEHAGIPPKSLQGSKSGVYVGMSAQDFGQLMLNERRIEKVDPYVGTGSSPCVAAGRISYALGLHGPALAIDTACSSALAAIDVAVRDLRNGRCDLALAGGVSLLLSPLGTIYMSKLRALSPTGRCRSFDADADGYVRGEGCGVIALKRLSDATASGDSVLAVIAGAATNHDGRSSGLTVPNGSAQEALLREALKDAGLAAADVSYVEAHGTGTPLGDPIEMHALGAVFGEDRPADRPLLVGTVKSNIGHLEAAAGVAGVIKTVLAMQHGCIPPSLHFTRPNTHIRWDELPVSVVTEPTAWPEGRRPTAGVSAFGFSGTNAHVILQAAPPDVVVETHVHERPAHVLTLSAASEPALRDMAGRLEQHLARHPDVPIADAAYAANTGRSQFSNRIALVARDTLTARARLAAFAAGGGEGAETVGHLPEGQTRKLAFLFTGQGAQYLAMGRRLYETEGTFRATIDECDHQVQSLTGTSLTSVLYPGGGPGHDSGLVNQTMWAQPATFAIELALARLWQSWGLQPAALLGHSLGEYVAACIAGVFDAAAGVRLVTERGRLMQALPTGGRMVAIPVDETSAREAIERVGGCVSLAAINGPQNVVVSGAEADVDRVLQALGRTGAEARPLIVSHAFHSPLMEPMIEPFATVLSGIRFSTPRLRVISNVTGVAAGPEIATPEYWLRHVQSPVRFGPAIAYLAAREYDTFLEIGPNPTLSQLGQAAVDVGADVSWFGSLRRGRDDWDELLNSAARLHAWGAGVDWAAFDRPYCRRRVHLPTYPFQRTDYRYELIPPPGTANRLGTATATGAAAHPLLHERLQSPKVPQIIFQSRISSASPSFVDDHRVHGRLVFPLSGYLEMVLAAIREVDGRPSLEIRDLSVESPMILADDDSRTLQVVLDGSVDDGFAFEVFSTPDASGGEWTRHVTGLVRSDDASLAPPAHSLAERLAACDIVEDRDGFYARLRGGGIEYGRAFQVIDELRRGPREAIGRLSSGHGRELFVAHPGMVDGAFQIFGAALTSEPIEDVYLPIGLKRLRLRTPVPDQVWSHASLQPSGSGSSEVRSGDIEWLSTDGEPVLQVEGFTVKRATARALGAAPSAVDDSLYDIVWQPAGDIVAPDDDSTAAGAWVLVADAGGVADGLAKHLRNDNRQVTIVADRSDEGVRAAVETAAQSVGGCRGVVHLRALDAVKVPSAGEAILRFQREACGSLLGVVRALAGLSGTLPRLWTVTLGAQPVAGEIVDPIQSPMLGLANTIAAEYPDVACVRIDLDPSTDSHGAKLAVEILHGDGEDQVAFRAGARHVRRLVRHSDGARRGAVDLRHGRYELSTQRGRLDGMAFVPKPPRAPGPGEVEISVRASGLNFRDVLSVLGMYPGEPGPVGGECAGTVTAVGPGVHQFAPGDEVFGLAPATFSSHVVTPAALVAHRPDWLSAEQAAGVPVAYLTVWYGLYDLADIKRGDRVLIHSAAGGVGMAAVMTALAAGAEVYGTAGSPEKRQLVLDLGATAVFDSRSATFTDELRALTGGRGVDIVLNSLTGAFIPASLAAMAPGGRFLEIGKNEIWGPAQVAAVNPDVSYRAFDLAELAVGDQPRLEALLQLVINAFSEGTVRPVPHREFEFSQIADAFRFMAQARHTGKIVVSRPKAGGAIAETFDASAAYLVTGGFGGLGQRLVPWMVEHGARHLVILSRSTPSVDAQAAVQRWTGMGATIVTVLGDVAQPDEVRRALSVDVLAGRRLGGVFHTAGVLDDAMLGQQDWSRFERVLAPKLVGAWNLHELTADQPLDYFVLFSSTAGVFGAPGQANYAAANAFLDGLAHYRRAQGQPALSIDWGAWSEVGMAARLSEREQRRMRDKGAPPMTPELGLAALERIVGDAGQRLVMAIKWPEFLRGYKGHAPPVFERFASRLPEVAGRGESVRASALAERLRATPEAERLKVVVDYITAEVARIACLPSPGAVDVRAPLTSLGIDSLMSVELRNALASAAGRNLDATIVYDHPSVTALAEYLQSLLLPDSTAAVAQTGSPAGEGTEWSEMANRLNDMSADDIAALLTAQLASIDDMGNDQR